MRRILTATVAVLLALSGTAMAQDTKAAAPAAEKTLALKDLPQSLSYVERGPASNAIQWLATIMLQVDPRGDITGETLAVYENILVAEMRAKAMQQLIAMDLDFDGLLLPEERDAVLSRMDSRRKVDAALILSAADANGDGAISTDEMREAARAPGALDRRSENALAQARDLMFFDLDDDGAVNLQEMARGVRGMMVE
ncbi:hypothetical protein [Marimonas arenosa]|uniref:EF-hand domain-containing protein n=1 Tax=Marimonas arenosa TaxID=1795305 RepID=A0AAE4B744_9RHOB|nr:hypothetical protein [Marimonas arenosa]MDQ2091071.1 hypothetical protein [Marimonas arenosa]